MVGHIRTCRLGTYLLLFKFRIDMSPGGWGPGVHHGLGSSYHSSVLIIVCLIPLPLQVLVSTGQNWLIGLVTAGQSSRSTSRLLSRGPASAWRREGLVQVL